MRDGVAGGAMKEAIYTLLDGTEMTVEYDPDAPCRICGQLLAVGNDKVEFIDKVQFRDELLAYHRASELESVWQEWGKT